MNDKCRVKHDLARHEEDIEVIQKAQEVTQAEHDEKVRDGVIHLLQTDADIVMEAITEISTKDFAYIRVAMIELVEDNRHADIGSQLLGEKLLAVVTAHLTDHVENTI